MKIINEKKKTNIVMENKETLEVTTLNGNHIKLTIKCLGGTLHLEENTITEEEKAIKTMEEYLKKEEKVKKTRM